MRVSVNVLAVADKKPQFQYFKKLKNDKLEILEYIVWINENKFNYNICLDIKTVIISHFSHFLLQ